MKFKNIALLVTMSLMASASTLANVDATFTGSIDSTCNVTSTSPGVLNTTRASEGIITVDDGASNWAGLSVTNNDPGRFMLRVTTPQEWNTYPEGLPAGGLTIWNKLWANNSGGNTFTQLDGELATREQVLENSGTDAVYVAIEARSTTELIPGDYSAVVTVTCVAQ